jgi:hypothetical protein
MRCVFCVAAFAIAPCMLSAALDAQTVTTSRVTTAEKVALIAVDSILGGHTTRVVRRQHVRPQDIILVASTASAVDLAGAIHVLNGLRFQFGDNLTTGLEASPTNYSPSPTWSGSPYENWINAQLTRLRGGRLYRVDGVGARRAVLITLPAPRGRLEIMGSDSSRGSSTLFRKKPPE